MSRSRHPGKKAAKAIAAFPVSGVQSAPGAPELLSAAADALNALDAAGIPVTLAHGAVITDVGYVFALGGEPGPWRVRSRMLAPFPFTPGDD